MNVALICRVLNGAGGVVGVTVSAPTNTVAPAVSGTTQTGQTLTSTTGTWTGAPSYTYQWKRGGSDIGGATSSTYVLTNSDLQSSITCVVTGTNAGGSASATSNAITGVYAATDSFNRADNATTGTALGSADSGQAWTISPTNRWKIASNKAGNQSFTGGGQCVAYLDAGVADCTVQLEVKMNTVRMCAGVAARLSDTNNFILAILQKTNGGTGANDALYLQKRVAGSYTTLGQVNDYGITNGTTYTIKLVLAGNVHTVYVDGVQKLTYTGTTGLESNTKHGISVYDGLTAVDDGVTTYDNFLVN